MLFRSIMLLDQSNMSRKHVDSYLTERQIEVNQLLEVTDMELLIEFSRIGIGIGCVIKELVADDLKKGTLIEIPLPVPIPSRIIGFACHLAQPSDTLREFLEYCQSYDSAAATG